MDAASGDELGRVDDLRSFSVSLPAYGAMFLLLSRRRRSPSRTPAGIARAQTAAVRAAQASAASMPASGTGSQSGRLRAS